MSRNQRTAPHDSVPPSLPDTTPPAYQHPDYSFTLQSIMEVQKAIGQVTAKIDAQSAWMDKIEKRLETVDAKLSGVTQKLYAAGVVLAIFMVIGGFLVNKTWDLVVARFASPPISTVTPAPR